MRGSAQVTFEAGLVLCGMIALIVLVAALANAAPAESSQITLTVPAATPLRLYLTHRVSKKLDAPVEAKVLTPLYAFDREVIPAGAVVSGRVGRLDPVSKWERIRSVLGGDFTPLRIAQVEFSSVKLGDGHEIEIHTVASPGLNSLVSLKPSKKAPQSNSTGLIGTAKQQTRNTIYTQLDRLRSIPEMVRGPGKKEMVEDYALSRLPYHPQYVHSRTRFDAELAAPVQFGQADFQRSAVEQLGTQPPAGSTVAARLITPLDSFTSSQGEKVEAVLERPLFSADHKLILPEGTRLEGVVSLATKARWFHRGGKLRFNFQNVEVTPDTRDLIAASGAASSRVGASEEFRTQAIISDAEAGDAPLKVDKEGGVQAKESKTRFIGTGLALLAATRAADNDPIHAPGGEIVGRQQNVGGRTLGGGLGFGLFGSIAAQSSRTVGAALGWYGLAWSVYSTVIARGREVEFRRNAAVDIGFNPRK